MTTQRPAATVSLPATIDDHPAFADRLAEVVAGVLGQVDLDSRSLRVESAASDEFVLAVGGRPALLGLSTAAADQDVLLDEISLRLLRRLELWEPDDGPLRGVNHYLAQLGMGPHTRVTSDEPVIVAGEQEMDHAPDTIELEVPAEVARHAKERDIEAVVRLRRDVFARTGVELPDVFVTLSEPRLRRIRIRLNATSVTVRTVPPGSDWGYVVNCLQRVLEGRVHWFVRREQVERTLDNLWYVVPDLVESCRRCYPSDVLTACLRELVRHGQSLRNLTRIMWLLLDLGSADPGPDHFLMAETPLPVNGHANRPVHTHPVALASRVRKCIREEEWRVGALERSDPAARLSGAAEAGLVAATDSGGIAPWEWAAVAEYASLGRPRVVVVRSIEAITPVSDALQCVADPPDVIASQELPPDVRMTALPVAAIGAESPSLPRPIHE